MNEVEKTKTELNVRLVHEDAIMPDSLYTTCFARCSWVKREMIEKRPTGYEDDQEEPEAVEATCCLAGAAIREDWR